MKKFQCSAFWNEIYFDRTKPYVAYPSQSRLTIVVMAESEDAALEYLNKYIAPKNCWTIDWIVDELDGGDDYANPKIVENHFHSANSWTQYGCHADVTQLEE